MQCQNNKGFTLIELLVVISIIGILASVILGFLGEARTKAQNSAVISEVHEQQTVLGLYETDHDGFPPIPGGSATYGCLTTGCEFAGDSPVSLVSLAPEDTQVAKAVPPKGLALTADAILSQYSAGNTSLTSEIPIGGSNYRGLVYFCDQSSDTTCTGIARIYYPVRGTYAGACGSGQSEADDNINSLCYQNAGQLGSTDTSTSTGGNDNSNNFTYSGTDDPYYSVNEISGYSNGTGWYNNGDTGWYGNTVPPSPYSNLSGYGTCLTVYYYNGGTDQQQSYCDNVTTAFLGTDYPYFSSNAIDEFTLGSDGWGGIGYYGQNIPYPFTNQSGYGNCIGPIVYYNGGSPDGGSEYCDNSGGYLDSNNFPYFETSDATGQFSYGYGWNGSGYYKNSIPSPYYYQDGTGNCISVYYYYSSTWSNYCDAQQISYTYDSSSYPYYSSGYISDMYFQQNNYGTGWYNNGDTGYYSNSAPGYNYPYQNSNSGNCIYVYYYNYGSPTNLQYCDSDGLTHYCSGTPYCSGSDSSSCTSSNAYGTCQWMSDSPSGYCNGSYLENQDCSSLDSASCAATGGCNWNDNNSSCDGQYTTNADCSNFNYDSSGSSCSNTGGCSWTNTTSGSCNAGVSCDQYTEGSCPMGCS